MSDATVGADTTPTTNIPPETTQQTSPPPPTLVDESDTDSTDWRAEAEKYKALHKKQEDRAKANATAAKELETLRQQTMSDQERAVAQAKAEGRREARIEVAAEVAIANLRSAATGRLDSKALDVLLERVNLAGFINDNGEVDVAAIRGFVDGIAPAASPSPPDRFPDLGQGVRGQAPALNGDPMLSAIKNALNIP